MKSLTLVAAVVLLAGCSTIGQDIDNSEISGSSPIDWTAISKQISVSCTTKTGEKCGK